MCVARPAERVPLLLAPAMNREMWVHPATQRNLRQVEADGAQVLGVGNGEQACGEFGDGRMLEAAEILEELESALSPKLLAGKRVCITAGPTFEAIDPVRGITNKSSGKMGFAIARAARNAGARVDLIAGPVSLPSPRGVQRTDVTSARQMADAVAASVDAADIFIATAAVADWRPANEAQDKIKKDGSGQAPTLAFTENPDILANVAASARARSGALYCVGFAAESGNLIEHGRAKRARKAVPMLVGNIGPSTFGRDDNALVVFTDAGEHEMPRSSKDALATKLVAMIAINTGTER
jgi:phosphopantothenoylcysteine decarboxylase / phosphopantothenate---cysteine ligase